MAYKNEIPAGMLDKGTALILGRMKPTCHEEMVSGEESVVDLMNSMQLTVYPKYLSSSLCHNEINSVFLVRPRTPNNFSTTSKALFRGTGSLVSVVGTELSCEKNGD